nr:hypothetical protein HK105_006155 [Polyrhizophydium stewartii]
MHAHDDHTQLGLAIAQLNGFMTVGKGSDTLCIVSAIILECTVVVLKCESKSLHLFALVNLLGTKYSRIIERINQSHILGLVVTLVVIVMVSRLSGCRLPA